MPLLSDLFKRNRLNTEYLDVLNLLLYRLLAVNFNLKRLLLKGFQCNNHVCVLLMVSFLIKQ